MMFSINIQSAWLGLALFSQLGASSIVCDELNSIYKISQLLPLTSAFDTEQSHYWSKGASSLKPDCIVTPATTDEVVSVVKTLRNTTENFAIKSGGHNPNNYFSSIQGGALISTLKLNEVKLDKEAETVRIGPGNRWDEVGKKLEGTGYTVVGGRIGNVGVGGYMLGGGLSFMSSEYGWAANSVVEYELVLANATVITVSEASNPDLFTVLKGGGNNYGIITAFVVRAYPQGKVWGGSLFFNAADGTNKALLAAVNKFTLNYPDPKAGIIMTAELSASGIINNWIMFLYYNGPTPPAGVFDDFLAAKPFLNTCKTQSYSALLSGNNWAVLKGSIYTIATETVPLNPGNATASLDLLQSVYAHWKKISWDVQLQAGLVSSIAFQPMPRSMARIAREKGGDLYDFDDDADLIIIELNISYWSKSSTNTVDSALQKIYGGIRDRVVDFQSRGLAPDAYLPLFVNDAYYRQDVWGRLKPERRALAAEMRDVMDPDRLWADRTGGFKFNN
ncbi:FAD binding domain-containing protein [Stachybotrys elegans]|uniref:FAD binding domain-containing protein n=1 Tax=Stachybotrys elegans TaxID=80388 RepID=A0A8K0SF69_9HYPO|nr:FAD binding domain-containing protein [Stachybotrys elegans]